MVETNKNVIEQVKVRMRALLAETIVYFDSPEKFGNDVHGSCVYLNPETGAMCAVGRCLTSPKEMIGCMSAIEDVVDGDNDQDCLDAMMRPEYVGIPLEFWSRLQAVHDVSAKTAGFIDPKGDRVQRLEKFIDEYGDCGHA